MSGVGKARLAAIRTLQTTLLGIDLVWCGFLYRLFTGRGHPRFDGVWRYRFEFGEIWWPEAPATPEPQH